MKKANVLFVLIITVICFSGIICSRQINADVRDLEKSSQKWWSYHNSYIFISSNFIAIDNSFNTVIKENFLSMLTSCEFNPIKQPTINNSNRYKINKLGKIADKDISTTLKNIPANYCANFKMEGKAFPKFNFKDINGVEYNNENNIFNKNK